MKHYSMKQLSEASGVTPRNIRYYIARGLLPGASGQGRGSFYTSEHLETLEAIKRSQAGGLTLGQIRGGGSSSPEWDLESAEVPDGIEHWSVLFLDGNVKLSLREGAGKKSKKRAFKALALLRATPEEG